MRLLADENFPGDAVAMIRTPGHDVLWIRTECPGSSGEEVLKISQSESRLVLTLDKDFGELAFRCRLPSSSGVVLFRISTPSPAQALRMICTALAERSDWEGHFSVIEDARIRMTRLP